MAAVLSDDDIEKLFSGAPQFFARSESHFYGAPHPSVAFPFDEELEIRDLTDHVQIEHRAWSAVTAWPHLTRDVPGDAAGKRLVEERHKAHFHIRCRERPNMLSMQGLEKGTMGYQAALELPTGDSLEEEQFGFESVGTKAHAIVQARHLIVSSHGMLHRLPEGVLLDRLKRNGQVYRHNNLQKKPSTETHADLFVLIRPCSFVIDKVDPQSLTNQIAAILKCLGTSNVWIDLSRIEWRIRLGQVLWGDDDGDEVDDATAVHDADNGSQRGEERYWLLMQILLATELLLRLDAITEGIEYGARGIKPVDVAYFERGANQTVKWSLLLARSWLENIEISKQGDEPERVQNPLSRRAPNWLASLVYKLPIGRHKYASQSTSTHSIKGRQGQRQIDGLIHFARNLQWPGLDAYQGRISENAQQAVESPHLCGNGMPDASPAEFKTQDRSLFGTWDVTGHGRRSHGKPATKSLRRRLAAALHESGWLTKSYVFGLILPGEAMTHFLMATLLENDPEAMGKLGPFANLSGGFVYAQRSFWSTACIVGRVLAAYEGTSECMGWISTWVRPSEIQAGWVNIQVSDVPGSLSLYRHGNLRDELTTVTAEDMAHLCKKARLWGKRKIEKQSSILGDACNEEVLPVDFIVPYEDRYSSAPPSVEVQLLSLQLSPATGSTPATPLCDLVATLSLDGGRAPELLSYPASIKFWITIDGVVKDEFVYALEYDINFVTAHPCEPSHRVKMVKSPTSPTIQSIDVSGSDLLGKGSRSASRIGHPLHKYYQYTVIHISELIQKPRSSLAELLLDPCQGQSAGNNGVLVIDCITAMGGLAQSLGLERITSSSSSQSMDHKSGLPVTEAQRGHFGSALEVLVRAICAERGWNAILSRKRRGCLACAIREAGALGWRVIVRIE